MSSGVSVRWSRLRGLPWAGALVAVVALVPSWPGPSRAQEPAVDGGMDAGAESADAGEAADAAVPTLPESDDRGRAQALMLEGNDLMARQDYAAALERYRAAYAQFPSPKLQINIGTSLRHLGRQAEAAAAYESYLRDPQAEPARVAELQGLLAKMAPLVAWLTVEVDAPTARVRVDGTLLEGTGLRRAVRLDPGKHAVLVEIPGEPGRLAMATLRAGEQRTIRPTQAPDQAGTGTAQRNAGWALGALGVAGLAMGAVFGTLALVSNSEHDEEPIPALERAAEQDAMLAYVGLAAGAGALAVGLILVLSAPDDDLGVEMSAALGSGGLGGASMALRW